MIAFKMEQIVKNGHGSNELIPVFAETDFGTRIALAISPESTAEEFKKEFERAHINCFPELGRVAVHGLMVTRKLRLYHLPEEFPMKQAFHGVNGNWFLRVKVTHLRTPNVPGRCLGSKVQDHCTFKNGSAGIVGETPLPSSIFRGRKCNRSKRVKKASSLKIAMPGSLRTVYYWKRCWKRKKKVERKPVKHIGNGPDHGNRNFKESPCVFATKDECIGTKDLKHCLAAESDTVSETMSVSGIISKYFSTLDEFTNKQQSQSKIDPKPLTLSSFSPCSPVPQTLRPSSTGADCKASTDRLGPQVGRRLILASNNLGISASKKSPALSLYKLVNGASVVHKGPVKTLILESSSEDE